MHERDLQQLMDSGNLSAMDIHFARLLDRLSGRRVPEVFLAAALVSRATSKGHVCLDLDTVAGAPLGEAFPGSESLLCPKPGRWRRMLEASPVIGRPGDFRPLILDETGRLYLYRYWEYENALARDLIQRGSADPALPDMKRLGSLLRRLFPPAPDGEPDWQMVAAFAAVTRRLCVISGGPGTGKSTLIARILGILVEINPESPPTVALAAPTGKAASRLEDAVRNGRETLGLEERLKRAVIPEASTIHRLLGSIPGSPYFRHHAANPLPAHVVVIDEASMVDLALMSKLVQALPAGARLILLGDRDQLASVEAGAVLGDICDRESPPAFSESFCRAFQAATDLPLPRGHDPLPPPGMGDCIVELKKNFRFGPRSGVGRLSGAVNRGEGKAALSLLKSERFSDIRWKALPPPTTLASMLTERVIQGYEAYLQAPDISEKLRLFDTFRILCVIRNGPYGVLALNRSVERVLGEKGWIRPEKHWYPGRPILIVRNDYNLGLFNGDVGIILSDPDAGDDPRAFFASDAGAVRRFLPATLPEHETVYAMTVHKSQGSEFDRAVLILPDRPSPVLTRELLYTGVTRVKKAVEIWGREPVFLEGTARRTRRASGLREALWHPGSAP